MLAAEENAKRRALHNQGLTDREIAARLNYSERAINYWRRQNNLPCNHKPRPRRKPDAGTYTVPMEQALTPEQCEEIKAFFASLIRYGEMTDKPDVGKFMAVYREEKDRLREVSGI